MLSEYTIVTRLQATPKLDTSFGFKGKFFGVTFSLLHAREWLTGATVNYVAAMIIEGLAGNATDPLVDMYTLLKLVEDGQIELLIIPICNPDGYEYSWTQNRLWRKNRSQHGNGVDLNRNFNSKWGVSGDSSNPVSDVYSGPHACSEIETQALEQLFVSKADNIVIAFDFHTFSQLILWPWSYDTSSMHPNEQAHQKVATILSSRGHAYKSMQSAAMYASSGAASDFYAKNNIVSLTVELPPKFAGNSGFSMPIHMIADVGLDWTLKISAWVDAEFGNKPIC